MEAETRPIILLPDMDRIALHPHWTSEQRKFRSWLDERLTGQEEAKDEMTEVLFQIRNPLRDPSRPIESFILAGPSTTGKTELFKLLVEWVNGDQKHMLFFSGSDYIEKHLVQKLIGAPPGYIGFIDTNDAKYTVPKKGEVDPSGALSQHNLDNSIIGAKSSTVFILFDEWEKFHPAFNQFLLRALREGTGEMNNGSTVSFRNVVFGFTSNVAADLLEKEARGIGFNRGKETISNDIESVRRIVVPEICKHVPQEFRNRIDRLIIFRTLRKDESLALVDTQLERLRRQIAALKPQEQFFFQLSDAAKEFLLKNTEPVDGDDTKNRIPKIQDRIKKHLTVPLGHLLVQGDGERLDGGGHSGEAKKSDGRITALKGGDTVKVDWDRRADKLSFEKLSMPAEFLVEDKAFSAVTDRALESSGGVSGEPVVAKAKRRRASPGERAAKTARGKQQIVKQIFYIEASYRTLETLLAGRQRILACIEEAAKLGALVLMTEYTNRAEGNLSFCVVGPVEEVLSVKNALKGEPIAITGGQL